MTKATCRGCKCALGGMNRSGICQHCHSSYQCGVCNRLRDTNAGRYCEPCKRVLQSIAIDSTRAKGSKHPSVPQRVACYSAMVQAGIRLFCDNNGDKV
jgi:hypothetical protein